MSIFKTGGFIRKTTKKLAPIVGLVVLGAAQHAAAVNLVDPDTYDWGWEAGAEPTYPNECYGSGNRCLVDTHNSVLAPDKKNDGDNQLFDVWVPDGAGPFPIFIHAHGGGFTGGSKKRMALAGPLLANDDVVFITTNYRLEGQTPEGTLKSIGDVIDLIEYVKADPKYKVNPDQIFIGGGSAGGMIMNDIAYKEKVTGILGLWHWNLYRAESQPVDLLDQELLANVPLPVVHGHPEPWPWHNSHSAKDALAHAEANVAAGNQSTFFKALNEHPSMIGYPDEDVGEAQAYDEIQQLWIDGEWQLNYEDFDDAGGNTNHPNYGQALGDTIVDNEVDMLNLAEWIYTIVDPTPPPPPPGDFYDDYSSDASFNDDYTVASGTWKVRNAGTLDSQDMTGYGKAIVEFETGDFFTASVKVKTVSKNDDTATWQGPRLFFSYTSSGNYYEAYVKSNGKLILSKSVDGASTKIGSFQLEDYDDSVRNDLEIDKDGSSIDVYVNDKLYLNVQDSSHSYGNVGLRSSKSHVRFDNLRIQVH